MAAALRRFSCALALLLSVLPATAQTPATQPSFAILSLAGNALTVHGVRQQVGLHVSGQSATVFPIQDPVFDTAALTAADAVVRRVVPGAQPVLLMSADPGLYQAQNAMFETPAANADNRAYLRSLLKERGVSRLLLVTRLRDNARFELSNGHAGNGTLEGLGFFVDELFETYNKETRDRATGMVVPFAYVKVRLLDADTLAVLGEANATASRIIVRPAASTTADDIWLTLSNGEKTGHLRALLACAMQSTVPQLLAAAPAEARCQ